MKTIENFKNLIKENKNLYSAYKKVKFIGEIPLKDFLNLRKLFLFRKIYPYTMVSYQGLSNVYKLSKMIEENKTKGAFVECGVWKGGCAALMGFVAQKARSRRKIWLFDSFEGLPEPTKEDGSMAKEYSKNKVEGKLETIEKCVGPIEEVNNIFFKILKLKKEDTIIKKGWFQNTLPKEKNEIGPIAMLRLDGDWYESTKCCLENLYDNVTIGGYILIDDYDYWEGCKRAVDEFLEERNINVNFVRIHEAGVYFKKL
ncbi:MAG: TylF/MycF/NovP-related O-methyltransferase [bacterium]|nr:TylF/MycF/NovP-related O-methyltransferase [bacterium]